MLDVDLARLYEIETFNLNKAVKRNMNRFPPDFMFQLKSEEWESLKFQFGMSKKPGRGGRRTLPYGFTVGGVAMLSSILNSDPAIEAAIAILRVFAELRYRPGQQADLLVRMDQFEDIFNRRLELVSTQIEKVIRLVSSCRPIGLGTSDIGPYEFTSPSSSIRLGSGDAYLNQGKRNTRQDLAIDRIQDALPGATAFELRILQGETEPPRLACPDKYQCISAGSSLEPVSKRLD